MIQLEEVRSIFSMAEIAISGNLDIVPVQFMKAIERAHRKMQVCSVCHNKRLHVFELRNLPLGFKIRSESDTIWRFSCPNS